MEFRLSKLAPWSILLVTLQSLVGYTSIQISSTVIEWFFAIGVLSLFFVLPFFSIKKQSMVPVKLLLLYYFFSIVRGIFIAEIYWDYKALVGNGTAILLGVLAFTAINTKITREIYVFYLKYTLPLLLLVFPIISSGAVGFFIAPISLLIIFIPVLPRLLSILIMLLVFFTISLDFGARSNVIKFTVPLILLLFYYVPILRSRKLMNVVRILFILVPFVLFSLAISGKFNVFNMKDYIKSDVISSKTNVQGQIEEEDLRADTRTGLYLEVLYTAKKYNSWWLGRSPARGNETLLFAEVMKKSTGRAERQGNEVAILNIFTWTGLIGVCLYFLVFYQASYLAVMRANNIFSQILGVFIAFRWLYAWVEDTNYYTSTTFILWIAIGLCYSNKFRGMSNLEVKLWIRGVLYKRIDNKIMIFPKNS